MIFFDRQMARLVRVDLNFTDDEPVNMVGWKILTESSKFNESCLYDKWFDGAGFTDSVKEAVNPLNDYVDEDSPHVTINSFRVIELKIWFSTREIILDIFTITHRQRLYYPKGVRIGKKQLDIISELWHTKDMKRDYNIEVGSVQIMIRRINPIAYKIIYGGLSEYFLDIHSLIDNDISTIDRIKEAIESAVIESYGRRITLSEAIRDTDSTCFVVNGKASLNRPITELMKDIIHPALELPNLMKSARS